MKPVQLGATLGLLIVAGGCAGPVAGLWPPPPGEPGRPVLVSVDTWHAVIAIPHPGSAPSSRLSPPAPNRAPRPLLYEEWGYAEQSWYLEGRQGVAGAVRALFWPSAGVIEVGTYPRPWSERTPDPPAEQFRFTLSAEGYLRLREFLEHSRSSGTALRTGTGNAFYPARRMYSLFHHCHQYAARALRAAGLPVSPLWALTRTAFVVQLRRAERLAGEKAHRVALTPEVG